MNAVPRTYKIGDYFDTVDDLARQPAKERSAKMRWYVAQMRAGTESKVQDHLKRHEFDTYAPRARVWRPVPKRFLSRTQRDAAASGTVRKAKIVPVFPGYLFVNFDIDSGDWHRVFERAGIIGLLCKGEEPTRLVASEVARVKSLEVEGLIPGATMMRDVLNFELGENVRVTDGPFASFSGVIERLPVDLAEKLKAGTIDDLDDSFRARVAVNIFGRLTPVELAITQIAKL